jgi:hypothetical protein
MNLASLLTIIFNNQNFKQGNRIRSKTNHSNKINHEIANANNRQTTSTVSYKVDKEYSYNKIFGTNEKLYKSSNDYLLFNSSSQDPIYSSLNMTLLSSFTISKFNFYNSYYFKEILCTILFIFKYLY